MNDLAPEYTFKEKVRLIVLHSLWVGPLLFFFEYYFFPALKRFSKIAHCIKYDGGYTGSHLLIYGVMVGMPILMILLSGITIGPIMQKVYKCGQFPPKGMKVLHRTKISYGFKARLRVYLFLFCILLLSCLAIWGYYWSGVIMSEASVSTEDCVNILQ